MNHAAHDSFLDALLATRPEPAGIRFRTSDNRVVEFSAPTKFDSTLLPNCPGIYVALVRRASLLNPGGFRFGPIYFGEAQILCNRVVFGHHKFREWCRAAGGRSNLYLAYCKMRWSSKLARKELETALMEYYESPCNEIRSVSLAARIASFGLP